MGPSAIKIPFGYSWFITLPNKGGKRGVLFTVKILTSLNAKQTELNFPINSESSNLIIIQI